MVTPLVDQDQLDLPGLDCLIERMLGGGVHALFALGTTGEGPSLGYALRHQLVEQVCEQVAGRVPVLVGITDTAFEEAVDLAQHAYDAGAAAVVAAAPYYLPLSQNELTDYVEQLVERLPLPLFLYNMPSCTKVTFELPTVAKLVRCEKISGLKDSSGDLAYVRAVKGLLGERPDFSLLVGPEELLAEAIACGAHGGVNGGANMFPQLYVRLYEAASAGKRDLVDRLHTHVMEISRTIYSVVPEVSRNIRGTKCALKCLGVCDDYVALPLRRLEGAQRELVVRHVRELCARLSDLAPCEVADTL
jgi:4-hydroxy-tetrahydrodipicolinate synthase